MEAKILEGVPALALLRLRCPEAVLLIIGEPTRQNGAYSIGAARSANNRRIIGMGRHKNVGRAAKHAVEAAIDWLEKNPDAEPPRIREVRSKEPARILWNARMRRGRMNEARVLEALRSDSHVVPDWVLSAHPATQEEDRRGIDVVVRTNRGDLWIQVKSRQDDVQAFRELHPDERIIVVVVNDRLTSGKLRRRLRAELDAAYAKLPRATPPPPSPAR